MSNEELPRPFVAIIYVISTIMIARIFFADYNKIGITNAQPIIPIAVLVEETPEIIVKTKQNKKDYTDESYKKELTKITEQIVTKEYNGKPDTEIWFDMYNLLSLPSQ